MAIRTTAIAVQDILGDHYGPKADGTSLSLTPFMQAASILVSRVATCATEKGHTLSTEELELIERWLSAHFYERADPMYQSKSTEGASATFLGQTGMHLESTYYGQTAMDLDTSGCLAALSKRQVATMSWLGKPPSEQTDYVNRS